MLLAPAILCHKEPAWASKDQIGLCSSLILYGIRIGGFLARKGSFTEALHGTLLDLWCGEVCLMMTGWGWSAASRSTMVRQSPGRLPPSVCSKDGLCLHLWLPRRQQSNEHLFVLVFGPNFHFTYHYHSLSKTKTKPPKVCRGTFNILSNKLICVLMKCFDIRITGRIRNKLRSENTDAQ